MLRTGTAAAGLLPISRGLVFTGPPLTQALCLIPDPGSSGLDRYSPEDPSAAGGGEESQTDGALLTAPVCGGSSTGRVKPCETTAPEELSVIPNSSLCVGDTICYLKSQQTVAASESQGSGRISLWNR